MDITDFYKQVEQYLDVDEAARTYSLDGVYSNGEYGVRPQQNLRTILDNMYRKDEVLSGAIATKVDAVPSYKLIGSNQRNIEKTDRLWNGHHERFMWYNLFLYGNCFFEVERNANGTPIAFHPIETMTMEIVDEQGHGEVDYYIQRWNKDEVVLPADDVLHFTLDKITTGLWAEIPVHPLALYIAIKHYIKSHISIQFKNNLFRPVLRVPEGAKEDNIKSMLTHFKHASDNRTNPFVLYGDTEVSPLSDFSDAENFKEWIQIADNGILMHMQVPPIMAGMPDNSGRSSGEQQTYKAFNSHINGILKFHEIDFKQKLESIGVTGVEKKYRPIDSKSEKDLLEMADRLKNMGARSEKLEEWLNSHGFDLPDNFFSEESDGSTSDDMFPSRRPLGEGELNERVGTGSEGETREDQLIDEAALKHQILEDRVLERAKRLSKI